MNQSRQGWGRRLELAIWLAMTGAIGISKDCTLAEIVPDNTLGSESSIATPNNGDTDVISGGAARGANLFHSFEQFSVQTGRTAFFNNTLNIQNIISRVTGSSISSIDGLIQTNGTANLFLLNPNGIIFGQNARLNIGGSFIASTATSLKFADETEFSAAVHPTIPLLTISVPTGLQIRPVPGSIVNQSQATNDSGEIVGLQVQPGNTLALVGGEISLLGGNLAAPDGRIELGSVSGNNLVRLMPAAQGWALGYEGVQNFSNIQLSHFAFVNASGEGSGNIQVQGKQVSLTDGSQIETATFSSGDAGNLAVNASELVQLIGTSTDGQFASGLIAGTQGTGKAGNLTITTPELLIQDGAQVSVSTRGAGRGGNLNVNASKSVQLIGTTPDGEFSSALLASTSQTATGEAGFLTINTPDLIVRDGAGIAVSTSGSGKGGNLSVNASKSVQLIGSSVNGRRGSSLSVDARGTAEAGTLTINTPDLIVRDGAQIGAGTFSSGKGGILNINATESVQLIGSSVNGPLASGLFTRTQGTGEAGSLTINTPMLIIKDGAQIDTSTRGGGKGGDLSVNALKLQVAGTDAVDGSPSSLLTSTSGTGKAGNLTITTQQLLIEDGAQATVSSSGTGEAGDISINARSVQLDNSRITAQTRFGNGGNLTFNASDLLLLRRGSEISTTAGTAQAGGDGGNIIINTPFIFAVPSEDSNITANAFTGRGGNIRIKTNGIFGIQNQERNIPASSDITASSEFGVNGVVEINSLNVDPSRGFVELPVQLPATPVVQACQPGSRQQQSEFIVTGRGGLPPNPTNLLSTEAVWIDLDTTAQGTENSPLTATQTVKSTPMQLIEATGWEIDNKGGVVLTASASTATSQSLGLTRRCYVR